MKCIYCGCTESRVVDSRQNEDGTSIRRRRECESCGKRFTTYEHIENAPLYVIKRDGTRQIFDASKVNSLEQEVSSSYIGDLVMELLRDADDVAYVRYASVHRQFKDINTLLNEIEGLVRLKEQLGTDGKKKK